MPVRAFLFITVLTVRVAIMVGLAVGPSASLAQAMKDNKREITPSEAHMSPAARAGKHM